MSDKKKIIDWEAISTNPFEKRNLTGTMSSGGQTGYTSMKDKMNQAYEQAEFVKSQAQNLDVMFPAMQKLLHIRLRDQSPIKVLRPLQYQSSEFFKSDFGGGYADTIKFIRPGTTIFFKSSNKSLQSFLFEDQNGEEIEIFWIDHKNILLSTDIYEVVSSLYGNK